MKKLIKLLEEYRKLQDNIHKNRTEIKKATHLSQEDRSKLNEVKEKMLQEMGDNFAVYEFCMKEFGVIDWRFHTLYYLLFRSVK